MLEAFLCGYSLFCHVDNLKHNFTRPKYPPDVEKLCYYFEGQKTDLPEYCQWKSEPFKPRRRSEF